MTEQPLLEIDNLRLSFDTPRGIADVVNGVSLRVGRGRMHGLVGESGSGKSVTARSVLGILPKRNLVRQEGRILFDGRDILGLDEETMRKDVRGRRVSMVFQDPMTALNPAMRIGPQIMNPLRQHSGTSKAEAHRRAIELLDQVGIPKPAERVNAYPHEMSGGQRQRVMIAIALSCDPELLIADEPTTALDVTVQAQILDLFDQLRAERNLSILLVSHDLSLIAERCDEVSVMYAGRIVESGTAKEIFRAPQHPYSQMLEAARPTIGSAPHTKLKVIPGRPPQLVNLPDGCAFASRCPFADATCEAVVPYLDELPGERRVACHHPLSASADFAGATP